MSEPYGEAVTWQPDRPRIRPLHTVIGWAVSAASVYVAAWILPGLTLHQTGAAFLAAAAIAVLNAILPPILASLRLPFMVAFGFLLVLFADAFLLCSPPTRCPTTSRSAASATRCWRRW